MTVFDTSALTRPLFTDAEFTATKWNSAAQKAAFANALCRFIAADFRESLFTQNLYRRLALSFGHIAHDVERVVMRRLALSWQRSGRKAFGRIGGRRRLSLSGLRIIPPPSTPGG